MQTLSVQKKYKIAYDTVLSRIPYWKREVVKDKGVSYDDRIVKEFLKDVSFIAESDNFEFLAYGIEKPETNHDSQKQPCSKNDNCK